MYSMHLRYCKVQILCNSDSTKYWVSHHLYIPNVIITERQDQSMCSLACKSIK